jgi:NitT/TauT family transport system substrate-binding protein
LQAATLPDPLAQSAMASGAILLIDDRAIAGLSLSVLSFTNDALGGKLPVIKRFLAAWNLAVQHINAAPEAYRALLIEKIRIPANVQADYRIPPFAYRQVPSQAQWQDVMTWMVARRLLDHPIDFQTSVATDLSDESGAPSHP